MTATQATSLFRPTTEVFTLSPHLSQATWTKKFLYKCKFPLCFILYMQIGDVKTHRLTLSNSPTDNERHFKRIVINVDDYFFRVCTIMPSLNTLTYDRFVLTKKFLIFLNSRIFMKLTHLVFAVSKLKPSIASLRVRFSLQMKKLEEVY